MSSTLVMEVMTEVVTQVMEVVTRMQMGWVTSREVVPKIVESEEYEDVRKMIGPTLPSPKLSDFLGTTKTAVGAASPLEDESASTIILIAVLFSILLVLLCLAIVFIYMLRHKGSYLTHEDKNSSWGDAPGAALTESPAFQDDSDEDV